MEPVNNPYLSEYISKLGKLIDQVTFLINTLNNSGMEGIQITKSVGSLNNLLTDLKQHRACIQDYSIFFGGAEYDDMD